MKKSKFSKFMVIVLVVLLSGMVTTAIALAGDLDVQGFVDVDANDITSISVEQGKSVNFDLKLAVSGRCVASTITIFKNWRLSGGTFSPIGTDTITINVPDRSSSPPPSAVNYYPRITLEVDSGQAIGGPYGFTFDSNRIGVSSSGTPDLKVRHSGTINVNVTAASAPSDTTAPTVNITVPTPDGNNGWFVTSPVVVDITATDLSNVTAILVNGVAIPDADITGLGTTIATASYNVSGDGIHDITVTATDGATPANTGAAAGSVNTATIKIDTTDPVVTFDSSAPTVYLLYEVAAVNWDASDATSGLATPASGSEDLDTNSVGSKYIEVTATDNAGNSETYRFNYTVQYNFGGILHPINSDGTSVFKQGSTIPVKFQLRDANGDFVTNATATISLTKISNGTTGEVNEPITTGNANTGNLFRYDSTSNQYIFNLGTRNLTVGTYRITINPGDGIPRTVQFGLR